jgi:arsenate reductase
MTTKNVLFVCSGNSVRSIMAEAYMSHAGRGIYRAYSAGSHPMGVVHPLAIETLRNAGIRPRNLSSKSWEVFALSAAPRMDSVIILCDQAARQLRPAWPGRPEVDLWSVPDPSAVEGSVAQQKAAFLDVFAQIRQHVDAVLLSEPPLGTLMDDAARGEVLVLEP